MHMKRRQRWLGMAMAIGVMTGAVSMAVPAQAQTTSVGPYYATPSWDQTLPAATRFIILSNFNSQAVLDRNTGLVWERSPTTTLETWNSARSTCLNKNVGGQKGFRLSSIAELASLIDPSVAAPGPTLPSGHPFNVPVFFYWSATSDAQNPVLAWGVDVSAGLVANSVKIFSGLVWCVRGGMTADQY